MTTPPTPSPPLGARLRRAARVGAALAAAASAGWAAAQETGGEAPPEARPPAIAYTVIDGARIETPLTEAPASAARGAALFADPETGGCTACHAAPGARAAPGMAPRLLRARLPQLPTEAEAAADGEGGAVEEELEAPVLEDATDLAPEAAPAPAARPDPDAPSEQVAEDDSDGADADPIDAEAGAPLLPLPQGPDLAGVGARLSEAELRLVVVNPRLRDPGSAMPAYHHVSLALAARTPALRQPWFSAQQVEDMVAYLASLRGASPPP